MFDCDNLLHLRSSELGGNLAQMRARHDDRDGNGFSACGELLSGGNGFPCRPIQFAASLFRDDENHAGRSPPRWRTPEQIASSVIAKRFRSLWLLREVDGPIPSPPPPPNHRASAFSLLFPACA